MEIFTLHNVCNAFKPNIYTYYPISQYSFRLRTIVKDRVTTFKCQLLTMTQAVQH